MGDVRGDGQVHELYDFGLDWVLKDRDKDWKEASLGGQAEAGGGGMIRLDRWEGQRWRDACCSCRGDVCTYSSPTYLVTKHTKLESQCDCNGTTAAQTIVNYSFALPTIAGSCSSPQRGTRSQQSHSKERWTKNAMNGSLSRLSYPPASNQRRQQAKKKAQRKAD